MTERARRGWWRAGLVTVIVAGVVAVVSSFVTLHVGVQSSSGGYFYLHAKDQILHVANGNDSLRGLMLKGRGRWLHLDWIRTGNSTHWDSLANGGSGGSLENHVAVPLWAVWPWILVLIAMEVQRRRRVPPGHCTRCRYDIRGLPDGTDVCPECGAGTAGAKSTGGEA